MTLSECRRLLKHFNELADGTVQKPFGHKDWADVVYNAKVRAEEMKKAIDLRLTKSKYYNEPENVEARKKAEEKRKKEETKKKVQEEKDGKR